jgi:hypothetical protein
MHHRVALRRRIEMQEQHRHWIGAQADESGIKIINATTLVMPGYDRAAGGGRNARQELISACRANRNTVGGASGYAGAVHMLCIDIKNCSDHRAGRTSI